MRNLNNYGVQKVECTIRINKDRKLYQITSFKNQQTCIHLCHLFVMIALI